MRKLLVLMAFGTVATVLATTNDLNSLLAQNAPIRIWNAHYMGQALIVTAGGSVTNTIRISSTNAQQYLVTINDTVPVGLDIPVRQGATLATNFYDLGIWFTRQQIADSAQLKQYALRGEIVVSNMGDIVPAVSDASQYGNTTASTNMTMTSGQYTVFSWSGSTKEIDVFNISTNAATATTNLYVYVGSPVTLIGKGVAPDAYFSIYRLDVGSIGVSSACANTMCQIYVIKR